MENHFFEIQIYSDNKNKEPFNEWFDNLDKSAKIKIFQRLDRIKSGNFGDYKSLEQGIYELRFKNGLRIYYGLKAKKLVLLLIGGNKSSQKNDIKKALLFWENYKERTYNEEI